MNDQVKSIDHVISNGTKMVSSSNYFAMEEVRKGGIEMPQACLMRGPVKLPTIE